MNILNWPLRMFLSKREPSDLNLRFDGKCSYMVFIYLILIGLSTKVFSQNTEIVYLSGTDAARTVSWDFYCTEGMNSGKWSKIDVPSNWELQGFGNYNYGHDWKDKNRKLGKEHGLYKHTFRVPDSWKGKIVNIVFDGSMTDTKVKINGKQAGSIHQGGFYRFKYDISKLLKYGETNNLEVDVAKHSANESVNRAERQADYWIFGGIFRPVFLEIVPKIHFVRTAIDAKADGSFNALVELNNPEQGCVLEVALFDLEGKNVGRTITTSLEKGIEASISGKFENVLPWNQEYPTLYDMRIFLKKGNKIHHVVTRRIGFRTVELRKHDGLYVNDKKVVLKGVNRHSFWPETGRSLSEENHLTDIGLIKEMNMNAVRMSHYVPDERFLELCDSLGLFVLDELTGWQASYDSIIGPKLIKEAVLKDENHPSVIMWGHGNEGGWNLANEKWFHTYDIQKRPVIYPGISRNGINTKHYPSYDYVTDQFLSDSEVFMPTEFLHGLYDGGLGAGLEDYWEAFESSPLNAGGFLWALVDEGVLRLDKKGTVFDTDGNHGADGILGSHREKEGSFYTIKKIWSPVQVKRVTINANWDGKLILENKYLYTDLNTCTFNWKAVKTKIYTVDKEIVGSGSLVGPQTYPGASTVLDIPCRDALQKADFFVFEALDKSGNNICTWSWPVKQPYDLAKELLKKTSKENKINVKEEDNMITASVNDMKISFSRTDGILQKVNTKEGQISLSGGPVPVGVNSKVITADWHLDAQGNFLLHVSYSSYPGYVIWKLHRNGLLALEVGPITQELKDKDFVGISFNYPESKCQSVKWMGLGPYRVWKNRSDVSSFGVWEKEYNNTITGENIEKLIYPEFKGYHANLYWMTLETTEVPFTIISETPNLFFQLFKPERHQYKNGGVQPPFPEADISFLYDIPAIGTKFKKALLLGPKSRKRTFWNHSFEGEEVVPIKLWFDFRNRNK